MASETVPIMKTEDITEEEQNNNNNGIHHQSNGDDTGLCRVGRLLVNLGLVKGFPSWCLEEVFFSGMIEKVKIDSVLPFILKMNVPVKSE